MPCKSLLQYGTTHFSAVLVKKRDCHPHISPPIIAKGTKSCVSTCIFLDTVCDLKWSHLPSPAEGKPLLYSPFKWAETAQEPPHICSHLHELPDGYNPGTACTPHTGSWCIFSACTTSVLTSVLQDEPAFHVLQKMDLAASRLKLKGFFLMMTLKFIPDSTTWQSYLHWYFSTFPKLIPFLVSNSPNK